MLVDFFLPLKTRYFFLETFIYRRDKYIVTLKFIQKKKSLRKDALRNGNFISKKRKTVEIEYFKVKI